MMIHLSPLVLSWKSKSTLHGHGVSWGIHGQPPEMIGNQSKYFELLQYITVVYNIHVNNMKELKFCNDFLSTAHPFRSTTDGLSQIARNQGADHAIRRAQFGTDSRPMAFLFQTGSRES
jgi:hypothetical protein